VTRIASGLAAGDAIFTCDIDTSAACVERYSMLDIPSHPFPVCAPRLAHPHSALTLT
jgi:hypothetical protein